MEFYLLISAQDKIMFILRYQFTSGEELQNLHFPASTESKSVCTDLWSMNCFLRFSPIITDETLLVSSYLIVIFMANSRTKVFVIPVQTFTV